MKSCWCFFCDTTNNVHPIYDSYNLALFIAYAFKPHNLLQCMVNTILLGKMTTQKRILVVCCPTTHLVTHLSSVNFYCKWPCTVLYRLNCHDDDTCFSAQPTEKYRARCVPVIFKGDQLEHNGWKYETKKWELHMVYDLMKNNWCKVNLVLNLCMISVGYSWAIFFNEIYWENKWMFYYGMRICDFTN